MRFFRFRPEIPFWANLVKNNKNKTSELSAQAKTWYITNSNMQNSMLVFTFSVLGRKRSFWENLVKNSKLPVLAEIRYQD